MVWAGQLGDTTAQIKELTTHTDMWGETHTNESVLVYKKTTATVWNADENKFETKEVSYVDYNASKVKSDAWKAEIDRRAEAEIFNNGNNDNNNITMEDINLAIENCISRGNESLKTIMATIKPIIVEEYEKNRITEAMYSQVYLGALQIAMQFAYTASQNEQQMRFQQTQMQEMTQSVKDNRLIKAGEFYSNMIGMGLSNNTTIPQNLYSGYFSITRALLGSV